MASCCCHNRRDCTVAAIIISAILGVIAAFLQISGVITVAPVFLWVSLGIAVGYLAILVATASGRRGENRSCLCPALNALLIGILGSILFSLVLLAVGITATSILSAILIGLLIASLALILTSAACYVRCLNDCD